MGRERILDVSALEPPEPFARVMQTIETLGEGEYLRMLHRREPFPLYAELDKLGFLHLTRTGRKSAFEILIWRRGDEAAEQAVRKP